MATINPPRPPLESPAEQKGRSRTGFNAVGVLLGAALVLLAAFVAHRLVWGGPQTNTPAPPQPHWNRSVVTLAQLPRRVGIRLREVAVTGGGGLIDLRFQVTDPERASALHDPRNPPALVEEKSGLFLDQLLMGHAHSGAYKQAVTYYLLFENSGDWVHRGSKVTVLLGNVEIRHVVVE